MGFRAKDSIVAYMPQIECSPMGKITKRPGFSISMGSGASSPRSSFSLYSEGPDADMLSTGEEARAAASAEAAAAPAPGFSKMVASAIWLVTVSMLCRWKSAETAGRGGARGEFSAERADGTVVEAVG